MPEGERNLRRRVQEQTVRSAREFYGDSLGRLEDMLRGDRAQLENLAEQLPEGAAEAQIRDMAGSYSKIEESLHRAARNVGGRTQRNPNGAREERETSLELRPVR